MVPAINMLVVQLGRLTHAARHVKQCVMKCPLADSEGALFLALPPLLERGLLSRSLFITVPNGAKPGRWGGSRDLREDTG
jgi:hypothetical protein